MQYVNLLDFNMLLKFSIVTTLLLVASVVVLYMHVCRDTLAKIKSSDSTRHRRHYRQLSRGYVLNLKYDGQQASAEHALVLQQCWLGALNLTAVYIVEPFLRQTVYQGYPPHQLAGDLLAFSDLHNLVHYNVVSRNRGFAEITTWGDFMENGPRNIVFVNLGASYLPQTHYSMQCSDTSQRNNCCLLVPKHDGMEFLSINGFCVVKVIGPEHSLSDHLFIDALFDPWKPEDVTVVFNHWMQANSAQHLPQCFRVFRRSIMTDLQLPSKQLLEESAAYRQRFLGSVRQMLSVMIRVERVIEQSVDGGHAAIARQNRTTRKAYLDKCFATLIETVKRFGNNTTPFVTTDIGKFSSNSWKRIFSELNYSKSEAKHVFAMTKTTVEKLVNQQFNDWENTFVNSTAKTCHWKSPAYIAALQRTIAINSDCLLLFGGGNFQEVALSAYLQKHPNSSTQCIHIICASRSLKRNLLDILR